MTSGKVRSSDAHSRNAGNDPSNGVGVGRCGCETVSTLMSVTMMSSSVGLIRSDDVEPVVAEVRHADGVLHVVDVAVVSHRCVMPTFDVRVLQVLHVQVLLDHDVEPRSLIDVDELFFSSVAC